MYDVHFSIGGTAPFPGPYKNERTRAPSNLLRDDGHLDGWRGHRFRTRAEESLLNSREMPPLGDSGGLGLDDVRNL